MLREIIKSGAIYWIVKILLATFRAIVSLCYLMLFAASLHSVGDGVRQLIVEHHASEPFSVVACVLLSFLYGMVLWKILRKRSTLKMWVTIVFVTNILIVVWYGAVINSFLRAVNVLSFLWLPGLVGMLVFCVPHRAGGRWPGHRP
jgi:hypothetical protein